MRAHKSTPFGLKRDGTLLYILSRPKGGVTVEAVRIGYRICLFHVKPQQFTIKINYIKSSTIITYLTTRKAHLIFTIHFDFVRVIPSCFRFAKMCLCQVSLLSRCSPRDLISSW
jgi:hypothetical protein